MRLIVLVAALATFTASTGAQPANAPSSRAPFAIAGQQVPAGQRVHIDIPIPAGSDPETYVPITVFHGTGEGPVLALTMGVHGYEFPSILAGQQLLERIDAGRLRGTVILVRISHVAAFEHRVPFVNPHDRKNLNRVFPGRADGTQAERIAWALTTEVIRRADVHVDLHSGDGAEWLEAFVGIYGGKLAEKQYATSRKVGLAFGFQNVITYAMDTQEQVDRGRSCNRQAVADGKPTVLVEIGENGRRDPAFVDALVKGVENLLRTLGMTGGQPSPARADTRWFDGTAGASATKTGIFTPAATVGRMVRKGEPIGTVRSYTNTVLEEIVSPVDGYVMYGLTGPPVVAGDSVPPSRCPPRRRGDLPDRVHVDRASRTASILASSTGRKLRLSRIQVAPCGNAAETVERGTAVTRRATRCRTRALLRPGTIGLVRQVSRDRRTRRGQ